MICHLGNLADHEHYLIHGGDKKYEGNALIRDENGYIGPICDNNWDFTEANFIS